MSGKSKWAHEGQKSLSGSPEKHVAIARHASPRSHHFVCGTALSLHKDDFGLVAADAALRSRAKGTASSSYRRRHTTPPPVDSYPMHTDSLASIGLAIDHHHHHQEHSRDSSDEIDAIRSLLEWQMRFMQEAFEQLHQDIIKLEMMPQQTAIHNDETGTSTVDSATPYPQIESSPLATGSQCQGKHYALDHNIFPEEQLNAHHTELKATLAAYHKEAMKGQNDLKQIFALEQRHLKVSPQELSTTNGCSSSDTKSRSGVYDGIQHGSATGNLAERIANSRVKHTVRHCCADCCPENTCSEIQEPNSRLGHFVGSNYFLMFSLVLIASNAMFVGLEGHMNMQSASDGYSSPGWLKWTNRLYVILFGLEVALQVAGERLYFFLGPDSWWNIFDLLVVLLSVLAELAIGVNADFLRMLRLLRVARILRLFRVLRYFRNLRKMAHAISACIVSLSWAFVLLVAIMYTFAVILMQSIGTWAVRENVDWPEIISLYGTLEQSMFTLFFVISGGMDWKSAVDPLLEISRLYMYFYGVYVTFMTFGVLNVLTGVFLVAAQDLSDRDMIVHEQWEKENEFANSMKRFLGEVDTDRDGTVTKEEFHMLLERDDMRAYLAFQGLDVHDAASVFQVLDEDHSGVLPVDHLVGSVANLMGSAKSLDMMMLSKSVSWQNQLLEQVLQKLCGEEELTYVDPLKAERDGCR